MGVPCKKQLQNYTHVSHTQVWITARTLGWVTQKAPSSEKTEGKKAFTATSANRPKQPQVTEALRLHNRHTDAAAVYRRDSAALGRYVLLAGPSAVRGTLQREVHRDCSPQRWKNTPCDPGKPLLGCSIRATGSTEESKWDISCTTKQSSRAIHEFHTVICNMHLLNMWSKLVQADVILLRQQRCPFCPGLNVYSSLSCC